MRYRIYTTVGALALVVAVLLGAAGSASAQHRGREHGWGGGGGRPYQDGYYGSPYRYGNYYGWGYGNRWYRPYSYWGWGYGYPYAWGYGYYPYTTYDYPSYANSSPPDVTTAEPAEMPATIQVRVPTPDAQVWIENAPTQQRGTVRSFQSPPLETDSKYTYHVRARWMENGQPVEKTKTAEVHGGEPVMIDFTPSSSAY
jgi:uncharacterized protein (TIGR03000 family)